MEKEQRENVTNYFPKSLGLEERVNDVAILTILLSSAHTLSPENMRLLARNQPH